MPEIHGRVAREWFRQLIYIREDSPPPVLELFIILVSFAV